MTTQKKTKKKSDFKRPAPTKSLTYHVAPSAQFAQDGTPRARKRPAKGR